MDTILETDPTSEKFWFNEIEKFNIKLANVTQQQLNAAIAAISSAHRITDYVIKLPSLFTKAQSVVLENNPPNRIVRGSWTESHNELCHRYGIQTEITNKASGPLITSGYLVYFKQDSKTGYLFLSDATFTCPKPVSKLVDERVVVLDEGYNILRPIDDFGFGQRLQKLNTKFSTLNK